MSLIRDIKIRWVETGDPKDPYNTPRIGWKAYKDDGHQIGEVLYGAHGYTLTNRDIAKALRSAAYRIQKLDEQ
jgi:hypothetical protein